MGSLGTDGLKTEEQKEKAGQRKVNRGGTMGLGEDTSKALKLEVGVEDVDVSTNLVLGDNNEVLQSANAYSGKMTSFNANYLYENRFTNEKNPSQAYIIVDGHIGGASGSLSNGTNIRSFDMGIISGIKAETAIARNVFLGASVKTGFSIDSLIGKNFYSDNNYGGYTGGEDDLRVSAGGIVGVFNGIVTGNNFPFKQNTTSLEGSVRFNTDNQIDPTLGLNLTIDNIWENFRLSAGFNTVSYDNDFVRSINTAKVDGTQFNVGVTYKF